MIKAKIIKDSIQEKYPNFVFTGEIRVAEPFEHYLNDCGEIALQRRGAFTKVLNCGDRVPIYKKVEPASVIGMPKEEMILEFMKYPKAEILCWGIVYEVVAYFLNGRVKIIRKGKNYVGTGVELVSIEICKLRLHYDTSYELAQRLGNALEGMKSKTFSNDYFEVIGKDQFTIDFLRKNNVDVDNMFLRDLAVLI